MELQRVLDFVLGRRLVEIKYEKVMETYVVRATIHDKPCIFRKPLSYEVSYCSTEEGLAKHCVMQYINDHVLDRIPFKAGDDRDYNSVRIVETKYC